MKLPTLNKDELLAGLVMEDSKPHYWLILLPGDHEDTTWQVAVDWAKSIGGELPTRREQSLLFANGKQHFERDWYWSGELYASEPSCAWCQDFYDGGQYGLRINRQCRARAVRRVML